MSDVTVYTKPGCIPCRLTKKHLDNLGVDYHEGAIESIANTAAQYGIAAAPVVEAGGEIWGGYRPDRLDNLAK